MEPIRRALLSVTDKSGLVEFGEFLAERGVEILSTGGTAKMLRASAVPVVEVSDFTGFPEMLDGRVKTLHPKIHGGILGRRDLEGSAGGELHHVRGQLRSADLIDGAPHDVMPRL